MIRTVVLLTLGLCWVVSHTSVAARVNCLYKAELTSNEANGQVSSSVLAPEGSVCKTWKGKLAQHNTLAYVET